MNEQKHVDIVLALAENELDSLNELGRDDADTREHYEKLAESYSKVYVLLKAAPELLEALETIEAAFGAAVDDDTEIDGADAVDFLSDFIRGIRPVLAKARGQ